MSLPQTKTVATYSPSGRNPHEAAERVDPIATLVNTLLGQVEDAVRTIKEHGGEAQLRAVMSRLLPTGSQDTPPAAPQLPPLVTELPLSERRLRCQMGIDALQRAQHKLPCDAPGRDYLETPIAVLRAALAPKFGGAA